MAFSWFNFAIRKGFPLLSIVPKSKRIALSVLIALLLLIMLVNQLQAMGRYGAWHEDVAALPGFGQSNGFGGGGGYVYGGQPMFAGNGQTPYMIQQAPGHSVVIQPNPGGVPTVSQVPGTVTSM
jgi:hypothetical protein